MPAAAQIAHAGARAGQQAVDLLDVHVLAVVAGAQQRQLGAVEPQASGGARLHQGQGLKGFECGAGEKGLLRVAQLVQHLALGVDQHRAAQVQAFAQARARGLDQGHQAIDGGHGGSP